MKTMTNELEALDHALHRIAEEELSRARHRIGELDAQQRAALERMLERVVARTRARMQNALLLCGESPEYAAAIETVIPNL